MNPIERFVEMQPDKSLQDAAIAKLKFKTMALKFV